MNPPRWWPEHARALPRVAATELVATLRSACFPLARLRPLPAPPAPRTDRPPVVLVHGFLGHPDMFRPLIRHLYGAGFSTVTAVRYPSLGLPLDRIVPHVDAAVRAQPEPVFLVGHSLGAVACRAYLKCFGGAERVRRFVSMGGPHAGTALFRAAPRHLWDALDPDGPWVHRLAQGPEPVPTVVIRSAYDHQVLPPVRATLPGIEEIVLTGRGHNGLLWSKRAQTAVVRVLTRPEDPR